MYGVDWSISFEMASGTNIECEGAAMVNGSISEQTAAHRKISSATDMGNMGGTGILSLSAGDLVQLGIMNESNAVDAIIGHANLKLVLVGH